VKLLISMCLSAYMDICEILVNPRAACGTCTHMCTHSHSTHTNFNGTHTSCAYSELYGAHIYVYISVHNFVVHVDVNIEEDEDVATSTEDTST
jgi:hypothetical protein